MKHVKSIVLLLLAAAWYGFFAFLAPARLYGTPRTQAEVAADTTTIVIELLKLVAPWVALIFVAYAVVLFRKESRKPEQQQVR